MADLRFRNIINGESVDAADGATYDLVNPATGEVYAAAPASEGRGRRPGDAGRRRARSRPGATPRPPSGSGRCSRSPTRSRPGPTSSSAVESREHRQAAAS